MANTYLTSGNLSSAGNQKKWTMSFWVKRAKLGATQGILDYSVNSTSYYNLTFKSTDGLTMFNNDGGSVSYELEPSMKFRDTSGWYHIVHQYDSAQATNSNRAKLWVNGVQQSSWTNESYPSQNANTKIPNSGYAINIGRQYRANNSVAYFDGSLSHFHFCDGYAYDASDFGETDTTTGEWKAKTSPSVTYGTNGFFILKDGNGITDQSGEGNDFTLGGGTLTDLKDNPDNTFATGNPLYYYNGAYAAWSNGNNTCYTNSGATGVNRATLGASSGKYYWEVKIGASDGAGNIWQGVGIMGEPQTSHTDELGNKYFGYGYWGEDGTIRNNSSNIATYSTFTTNDIISVALDMNNNKLYFAKNGTWQNSANPSSGTNGISINANPTDGFYFPAWGDWDNNNRFYFYTNFGNGYFGTTAVASAGTNASDNGIFEYDVPTGYTALSTKGLNL